MTYVLGLICTRSKLTAGNVNKTPNQSVEQTCVKQHRTRKTYCCYPCSETSLHANNTLIMRFMNLICLIILKITTINNINICHCFSRTFTLYNLWKLPEVEKIPPMMPHSLTRNKEKGICSSVTLTINGLSLYLIKIPDTPCLPFSLLTTRSYMTGNMTISNTHFHRHTYTNACTNTLEPTCSVTENWCMFTETPDVCSLVGTTVIKYWNSIFSLKKKKIRNTVLQSMCW